MKFSPDEHLIAWPCAMFKILEHNVFRRLVVRSVAGRDKECSRIGAQTFVIDGTSWESFMYRVVKVKRLNFFYSDKLGNYYVIDSGGGKILILDRCKCSNF